MLVWKVRGSMLHDSGMGRMLDAGRAMKVICSNINDNNDELLNDHELSLRCIYSGGGGEGSI